ncbi:MAG TPA: hypothetical protein DIW36_08935, partial [Ruminococcaceae bacterium]|nr:hypothetical protein [Oscillospiraceae bacterium]
VTFCNFLDFAQKIDLLSAAKFHFLTFYGCLGFECVFLVSEDLCKIDKMQFVFYLTNWAEITIIGGVGSKTNENHRQCLKIKRLINRIKGASDNGNYKADI